MIVFQIDMLHYEKRKLPSGSRYLEDKDTLYVAIRDESQNDIDAETPTHSFVVWRIYRKKSDGFHRTINIYSIDYAKWALEFITRTEQNKRPFDQRKELWNNQPTIFGMYRQQQKEEAKRLRERKQSS